MTTETEATVSSATKLRASRIKKTALIVLLLNTMTYALSVLIFTVMFPRLAYFWSFSPTSEAIKLSLLIAFLATAHLGRGYEIEFRERARNNPDLSRIGAIVQSALRIIAWIVISLCTTVVTGLFVHATRNIFGI